MKDRTARGTAIVNLLPLQPTETIQAVIDTLDYLEREGLRDVVLVGHSFGSLIAQMVTDRVPQRIAHLVIIDGGISRDGQSIFGRIPPAIAAKRTRNHVHALGGSVPLWEGLLLREATTTSELVAQVEAVLEVGASGIVLFEHSGILGRPLSDEDIAALNAITA